MAIRKLPTELCDCRGTDRSTSVKGDGRTDDSASLNAILAQNAANGKLSYFPYGGYIVKSTLYVPPGTRIVGEAWSVISGGTAVVIDLFLATK